MAHISPWQGFPETRLAKDGNGKRCFIVRPRVLTPFRAKAAEGLATVLALALMLGGLAYVGSAVPDAEWWVWIAAVLLPWIFRPVIHGIASDLVARETKIVLTESSFEVHGLLRRKVFDRKLDHSISLVPHDFTQPEMRAHDLSQRRAARNGQVIQKKPYYADSAVVSYDYLGQRNDVMAVYPRLTAHKVLMRLQACDAALNSQTGRSDGFASGPTDQWSGQPGDLPDDE